MNKLKYFKYVCLFNHQFNCSVLNKYNLQQIYNFIGMIDCCKYCKNKCSSTLIGEKVRLQDIIQFLKIINGL